MDRMFSVAQTRVMREILVLRAFLEDMEAAIGVRDTEIAEAGLQCCEWCATKDREERERLDARAIERVDRRIFGLFNELVELMED